MEMLFFKKESKNVFIQRPNKSNHNIFFPERNDTEDFWKKESWKEKNPTGKTKRILKERKNENSCSKYVRIKIAS